MAIKVLNYAHDFELIAPVVTPGVSEEADGQDDGRQNREKKLVGVAVGETLRQLDSFMRSEKLYLDPQLTIKTLGRKVSIPTNQLSELINGELGMNFCNYVNSFRLADVKKLLAEDAERNILDAASQAGSTVRVHSMRRSSKTPG